MSNVLPSAIANLRGERAEGIKHPAVAFARGLRSESGRAAAGRYLIHGPVLVERALDADAGVLLALYTPRLLTDSAGAALLGRLAAEGTPHALVGDGIMRTIVERAYLPEIVAVVARRTLPPDALQPGPRSLYLIANALANPSNLGMLVRTAYGAGVEALLLTPGSSDPFVWQVSTGSTGAIFRLPLVEGVQAADLARLRAAGVTMVAAVAQAERPYTDVDYTGAIGILVGNEAHGLTPAIAACADLTVSIPMAHHLDSLNVAVAAGVMLFEAQRQRRAVSA